MALNAGRGDAGLSSRLLLHKKDHGNLSISTNLSLVILGKANTAVFPI